MKGKMKDITEIRQLLQRLQQNQKIRRINRDTGIHRTIIREVLKLAHQMGWLIPDAPMPSNEEISHVWKVEKSPQEHLLDPYKEKIAEWHSTGSTRGSIQRLLFDLHGLEIHIEVIKRHINKYCRKPLIPIMVRTTIAGKDADVDFGDLGTFQNEEGKNIKAYLFSCRLRHSRKAYREIVLDQSCMTFVKCHIHAFEAFGGVPENLHPDCTKAAVIKASIENNNLNRSYLSCAEFYGFNISPCQPYRPQHKGGVEKDMDYCKRSCISTFRAYQKELGVLIPSVSELVKALDKWEREVDAPHIVQGVGRSPKDLFDSEEKAQLKPLPKGRWEPIVWAQCTVRRDWRIMWNASFYSVPYHLIGEEVGLCADSKTVRIFHQYKEVALHEKATAKGEYKRKSEHAPPFQEEVLQCSKEGLLELAAQIGSETVQYVKTILSTPNVDKLAPARLLLRLSEKHGKDRLEKACKRALYFKMSSYREVKSILENKLEEMPLEKQGVNMKQATQAKSKRSYKYARNPKEYWGEGKPSFDEQWERHHPVSKYGNALAGAFNSVLIDAMIDEQIIEEKAAQARGEKGPLNGHIPEPTDTWKLWKEQQEAEKAKKRH
jgi:transposase